MKELVSFKGIGDGVRICLDSNAPMYSLLEALERKLSESKGFFGDGNCVIQFSGRTLTGSEKPRLEALVKRLLPMGRITFDEPVKSGASSNEWILEYKRHFGEQENTVHPAEPVMEHKEQAAGDSEYEEFISVFRSDRARFYQGFLHEGAKLRSDGHLVLLGTVEEGASVAAVGNILILGGLYGSAHAGCNGHNGSYIMAMDMHPEQLAIAGAKEEFSYEKPEQENQEEAEPVKKSIFKLRKKSAEQKTPEEKTEPELNSAVALCKNNKIIIDNFTIQTFTNSKNVL